MDMGIPNRCDFLRAQGGIKAEFRRLPTAEGEEELPQDGVINCGLRSGGNEVEGSRGDRHVYRIVVARAGMAHRSFIFEGGNEGDASWALGGAGGGRF